MEDCGSSQSNEFWIEALGEIPDDTKKESSGESFEKFSPVNLPKGGLNTDRI